jgi:hypothetical protein
MKRSISETKGNVLELIASVQSYVRVADDGGIVDSRDEMCAHLAAIPVEQLLEIETHDLAAIVSGAVGVFPLETATKIVLGNGKFFSVRTGHAAGRIIESLMANAFGLKKAKGIHALLRRGLDYDEIHLLLFVPKEKKIRQVMPATEQPMEDANAE